jgi:hypothetical protein
MTPSGRTRLLAAALTAVALALTAPTYAAQAPARAAGTPAVGECRSLTLAEAEQSSDTSAAIDCSFAHDARVIAVPDLPSGVSYGDLDSVGVLHTAARLCYPAFRAALGQTDRVRDRSAYTYLYFVPTAAERAAGARWLRCDLTLRHGATLGDLPTDRVPALATRRVPAGVARCLAGRAHLVTVCTASHSYRATGSFTVDLKRFPGRARMARIGRNRCPALVSTDADFRFSWLPAFAYNLAHDRTIVCYSHTSR